MTEHTRIALTEHWRTFIADSVASGRFASAEEAIGAGLRLLEEEERKFVRLTELLEEGEASGGFEPWDLESFLAEERARDADREAA